MTDSANADRRPVADFHTPSKPPITCDEVKPVIASYVDQSLKQSNPFLFGRIRSHLEGCSSCQALLPKPTVR